MACCLCVRSGEVVVVERFGKFNRIARPGFACLQPWCCEFSAGAMNMRIQQLDLRCETKTEDNVFVQICVAVQFAVEKTGDMSENGAYWRAFYRLDDPQTQIRSYVSSVLRAEVPTMKLDVVFQEKERIAKAIKESLTASLSEYGYMVLATLVTDIDPDPRVKQAMNEINASQRLRVAAMEKAEADKIRVVKAAEADSDSKYLAGLGMSRQRQAIVQGLAESVKFFEQYKTSEEMSPRDVLDMMLMTQYFDMLNNVGTHPGANQTIFLPHGPGALRDTASAIRDGILAGHAAEVKPPSSQGMRR
mmetsp:Transcript_20108/g.56527  ORF Transcript_20108/g.56527 Transcript_20108/m.56527 type:complete len:304 (+) Transcript_20108:19-930(+)